METPAVVSDGTISKNPDVIGHVTRGDRFRIFSQSMSGDRGSARLERNASGIQMDEFGGGDEVEKFHGLRSGSTGGDANNTALARAMTAQIAQGSSECRSES
jgi:hypothetical protein